MVSAAERVPKSPLGLGAVSRCHGENDRNPQPAQPAEVNQCHVAHSTIGTCLIIEGSNQFGPRAQVNMCLSCSARVSTGHYFNKHATVWLYSSLLVSRKVQDIPHQLPLQLIPSPCPFNLLRSFKYSSLSRNANGVRPCISSEERPKSQTGSCSSKTLKTLA